MLMLPEEPDPSMRALIEEERDQIVESLSHQLTESFPQLLIPSSKTKTLSAIMEMKAGAGGDEASLFLSEILRMYTRFAFSNGFTPELVSSTTLEGTKGPTGGIRDAILEIKGKGSYDLFRWESGVHRVQRVPATETQGRTHTSTVAVVVRFSLFY
jgi:peptide chain release factor 1